LAAKPQRNKCERDGEGKTSKKWSVIEIEVAFNPDRFVDTKTLDAALTGK